MKLDPVKARRAGSALTVFKLALKQSGKKVDYVWMNIGEKGDTKRLLN